MFRLSALILSAWLALAPTWADGVSAPIAISPIGVNGAAVQFPPVSGGAAYQGPGDLVSGAKFWVGLRAYSLATAGTKAINLCDNTGSNCADISTNATTGKLNAPGTLGSNNCNTSGTCLIKTFYDQSGANFCAGTVACNFTQATAANMATLNFSCLNGLPCAVFNGTSTQYSSSAAMASINATGFTVSAVAVRTAGFTTQQMIFTTTGANAINLDYRALANAVQMFAGTSGVFISNISDSNFHAFQAVFNAASSDLMCGGSTGTSCSNAGTSNSLSPGAVNSSGSVDAAIGVSSGTNFLSGELTEVGGWISAFSGSNQTAVNGNQVSFWGPF